MSERPGPELGRGRRARSAGSSRGSGSSAAPAPLDASPDLPEGLAADVTGEETRGRPAARGATSRRPNPASFRTSRPSSSPGPEADLVLDAKTLRHLEISRPMNPDDPSGPTLLGRWDATVTAAGPPDHLLLAQATRSPTSRRSPNGTTPSSGSSDRGAELIAWRRADSRTDRGHRPHRRPASRVDGSDRAELDDAPGEPAWPSARSRTGSARVERPPGAARASSAPRLDPLPALARAPPERALPATVASERERGLFRPGYLARARRASRSEERLGARRARGARTVGAGGERDPHAEDRLQPGLRLLLRGHPAAPREGPGPPPAQADPLGRGAVHLRRPRGDRRPDPSGPGGAGAASNPRRGSGSSREVEAHVPALYRLARAVGELDTLVSFAVGRRRAGPRPPGRRRLRAARRSGTAVTRCSTDALEGQFVPNDTELDAATGRACSCSPARTCPGSRRTCGRSGSSWCSPRPGRSCPAKFARIGVVSASSPGWGSPTRSAAASRASWSR